MNFRYLLGTSKKSGPNYISRAGHTVFMPHSYVLGSESHVEGVYVVVILNFLSIRYVCASFSMPQAHRNTHMTSMTCLLFDLFQTSDYNILP